MLKETLTQEFKKIALFMPVALAMVTMGYMLSAVEGNTWNAAVLNNFFFLSLALLLAAFVLAFRGKSKELRAACFVLLALTVLGFLFAALSSFPGTGSRYGNQGSEVFVYTAFASLSVIVWTTRSSILYLLGAIILAIPITILCIYLMVTIPLNNAFKTMDLSKVCVIQMEFDLNGQALNPHRVLNEKDYEMDWHISERTPRIIAYSDSGPTFWSYTKGEFGSRDYYNRPPKTCPAG